MVHETHKTKTVTFFLTKASIKNSRSTGFTFTLVTLTNEKDTFTQPYNFSLFQLKAPSEAWSLLLLECNAIPFTLLKEGLETLHSLFFKGLSKVVLKILTILKDGLLIVQNKNYRIDTFLQVLMQYCS